MKILHVLGNYKIRCILNVCRMSYIWNMQNCISDNYKLFKHDLKFEDYLDLLHT